MGSTFEQGFSDAERSAEIATKSAAKAEAFARSMQKAARVGDINTWRRAARQLEAQLEALVDEVAAARKAWPFEEEAEVAYLQDAYRDELKAAASAAGVNLAERDGQLVCSPSIIRIQPGDRSVRIDRRRITWLRPSALVAELKKSQARPSGFQAQRFLETLAEAYRLLIDGAPRASTQKRPFDVAPVVQLEKIYSALTLQPGSEREYTRTDFARDLYLLDASGIAETRRGERVSFPASSGTRSGKTFQFITPDGASKTYYGIRFTKE